MIKKNKKILLISITIIAILCVGILIYLNVDVETVNEIVENNEIVPEEEISDEQLRETIIKLYFIDKNNEIAEEILKVDSKILIENPYNEALKALLNGPKSEELKTLIPSEVKINNVSKAGECVVIDLSKEFIENAAEDVESQGLMISQIVNTMTQFTEINAVKILIDGEANQSFKNGNIKLEQIFTNED